MPKTKPLYVNVSVDVDVKPFGEMDNHNGTLLFYQVPKDIEDRVVIVGSCEKGIVYTEVVPTLDEKFALAGDATQYSAPVTVQWLLSNFEMGMGVSLPRSSVYYHYIQHCLENQMEPVNAASFGKLMRSVFYGLKTRRLGTRGHSRYHYYGLQYKNGSPLANIDESIIENYANLHGLNGPSLKREFAAAKRVVETETVEELLRKRVKMDLYLDWPEDLVRLGLSVKEILKNEQKVLKMKKGFEVINLEQVYGQAFEVSRCQVDTVYSLIKEIDDRLIPGSTIHDWATWVERISGTILAKYDNTPQFSTKAKELVIKWSFFSSLIMREVTLQCSESFGCFILLNQFIADYLMYFIQKSLKDKNVTSEPKVPVTPQV